MSDKQPSRAELIARIATSTKDAVVLEEMQRLGFWPTDGSPPTIESALIQREAELVKTLDRLQAELRKVGDPQAALLAMRKQRMEQAKARREETAQRREKQRYERALAWHQARQHDIGYLGVGVSGGLNEAKVDNEQKQRQQQALERRRQANGLPPIESPQALAQAMGISIAELRFLCFHREVAHTTHYRRFALPKKTGGERIISAPMPRLKRAQYWVLDNMLAKVACHPAAHGFLPGRSIVSNAAPHCGQAVVINLDLKDFFPSIRYPRIKGLFQGLGYSEPIATLLALLCSENVCNELQVDGERFYVGHKAGERVLPQGAPTSPMLTNILCRQLDRRLQGLASKLGFAYTRYADDLSFSGPPDAAALTGRLLRQVHHVLEDEGFTPHPAKQQVMRSGTRHEVTGIVVNRQPAVPRQQRRALRAALHQSRSKGLAQATWQGQPASKSVLLGYAQFVQMVNARQGQAMLAQARALPDSPASSPALGSKGSAATSAAAASATVAGAATGPSARSNGQSSGQSSGQPGGPSSAQSSTQPGAQPRANPGTPSSLHSRTAFRRQAAAGQAPARAAGPWWQPRAPEPPQLQLTAGQIKAQRQDRLNAERAARDAAKPSQRAAPARLRREAEPVPVHPQAQSPEASEGSPVRIPWLTVALQFICMLYVAMRFRSALVFMVGTCWLGYRLMTRRFGWPSFVLPLLAFAVMTLLLKG